jgi:2-polyprenyl-3-methyl-5-hydroxy-6-metoxy-1,4-benzoquinol methylase
MALDYSSKEDAYFNNVRDEVLKFFPQPLNTVLEIGCGAGATLAFLKQQGVCRTVIGVELFPQAYEEARTKLDMAFCGDIESMTLPLKPGSIDAILCLDVLEHLNDPWKVVEKLTVLLTPEGFILASIPNVRHVRVLLPLALQGQWRYQNDGLLDKTHLRFFTRESAIGLLNTPQLKVTRIANRYRSQRVRTLSRCVPRPLTDFLASQYLIQARRA